MSDKILARCFELKLEPLQKLVLLTLANIADDDGFCSLSATSVATSCGIEDDHIAAGVLGQLYSLGYLTKVQSGKGRTPARYMVSPRRVNRS